MTHSWQWFLNLQSIDFHCLQRYLKKQIHSSLPAGKCLEVCKPKEVETCFFQVQNIQMAPSQVQRKALVSSSGMPAPNTNQKHTNSLVGQFTASSPTKNSLQIALFKLELSSSSLVLCQGNLTEDLLQSRRSERFVLPCFGEFLLSASVKRNKKASCCIRQDPFHHSQLLSKGIPEVCWALINQHKRSRFPWKLEFCSEGKHLPS